MNTSNDVQSKADLICVTYLANPSCNSYYIAKIVGCDPAYVRAVIRRRGYAGFKNRKYAKLGEKYLNKYVKLNEKT